MGMTLFKDSLSGDIDPDGMLEAMTLLGAIYWNDRVNAEASLAEMGGGQILLWKPADQSLPPARAVFKVGSQIMVCIPGTTNGDQMRRNVGGAWARPYPGQTGLAQDFFLWCWENLRDEINAVMPGNVAQHITKWVGHSLGGAAAFFGALEYAQRYGPRVTQYMGFGAPKSLDDGYRGVLPDPSYLVVNNNDGVPFLPPNDLVARVAVVQPGILFGVPMTWRHYKEAWQIDGLGNLARSSSGFNFFVNPLLWTGIADDHIPSQYMRSVEAVWERVRG